MAEAGREEAEAELMESGVCRPFLTGIREAFLECSLKSGVDVGWDWRSIRGLRSGMLGMVCGWPMSLRLRRWERVCSIGGRSNDMEMS